MSDDHYQKLYDRAREARIVRRIVFIIFCALIVMLLAAGLFGYHFIKTSLEPLDKASHKKVIVDIPMNSSVMDIGRQLQSKGIIKSARVFRYYVKYKNDAGFQAGTYQLSPSMSIDTIISRLQSGKVYQKVMLKLTIPEGYWTIDIAKRISEKTNLKEKDILKKLSDKKYIQKTYMKQYPFLTQAILNKNIKYPLEGYLFPATYSFEKKNPSLEEIITEMLDKTQSVLKQYSNQMANSKLKSVHDVLTMASIIEAEAPEKADRQKISGVFYNRLAKNIPLQTDPTIGYAMQKHIKKYTYADLKVKSAYNTYIHRGLPVGPICNPGEQSIVAAMNPKKTDALYFYARQSDGKVFYSKTYAEHQAILRKYRTE